MSLIKANAVQVGQSPTATQNFTLAVPSSPDGTIKLARGNAGSTTQDVLSVDASGNINGLVKTTGSTTARSLANRFADVVNVKDFGAVGDGVADDTAALQAAINSLSNGGSLRIPVGNYKLTNQINVPYTINIFGDNWKPFSGTNPSVGSGSIFICTFTTSTANNVFYVTAPGVQFRNIEIVCNYQPPDSVGWTPITTPTAIQFYGAPFDPYRASDFVVDNVLIALMSRGIYVNGCDRGEINLYGYTFGPLLHIDGNFDVTHIKNVHFWPFQLTSVSTNIILWVGNNSVAIRFGRADNPVIDKIFAFGVYAGIQFSGTTRPEGGSVQNAQISNIQVDDCYYGIITDQNLPLVSCRIANFLVYTNPTRGNSISPTRGIYVLLGGNSKYFDIANATFYECGGEAIRLDCDASEVLIANLRIGDLYKNGYNQSNNNFAAIAGTNKNKINIGQYQIKTTGAYGAPMFRATGLSQIIAPVIPNIIRSNTAGGIVGYEQYTQTIQDGNAVLMAKNFNRKSINISGAGTYTWTDTLAIPISTWVISAKVSSGTTKNVTNLCIYPNLGFPLGSQTTVFGSFETTETSGTIYIDWEVIGH